MINFFKKNTNQPENGNKENMGAMDRLLNAIFNILCIVLTISILAYLIAEAPNKEVASNIEKKLQGIMEDIAKIKESQDILKTPQKKQVMEYKQGETIPLRTKPATTTTIILENENITDFSMGNMTKNKPFKAQISKDTADTLILETAENSSGAKGKLRIFTEKSAEYVFHIISIDSKSAENPAEVIFVKAEKENTPIKKEALKAPQIDHSSISKEETNQNQEDKE